MAALTTNDPHQDCRRQQQQQQRVVQSLRAAVFSLPDPSANPDLLGVKAYIDGLSAEGVRRVEIERGKEVTLKRLPALFPARDRAITEVQRATRHLRDEALAGKTECHDTFPHVCLARNPSFNA